MNIQGVGLHRGVPSIIMGRPSLPFLLFSSWMVAAGCNQFPYIPPGGESGIEQGLLSNTKMALILYKGL